LHLVGDLFELKNSSLERENLSLLYKLCLLKSA